MDSVKRKRGGWVVLVAGCYGDETDYGHMLAGSTSHVFANASQERI